jgi:hypothetical protein
MKKPGTVWFAIDKKQCSDKREPMKTDLFLRKTSPSFIPGAASLACSLLLFRAHLPAWAAPDNAGLQPIFNGKDLTGWKIPDPNPFWRVVDGVLVGENDEKQKGHVLYTDQAYQDFMIETDVR